MYMLTAPPGRVANICKVVRCWAMHALPHRTAAYLPPASMPVACKPQAVRPELGWPRPEVMHTLNPILAGRARRWPRRT